MDDLEKEIINILAKKINTTTEYRHAIKTAFDHKSLKKYPNYIQIFFSTLTGIILTMGIVFAGYTTYEKIWKEPIKYDTYEEILNSLPPANISDEEKENIISENEAKNIANQFLKDIKYDKCTIKKVELMRDYEKEDSSFYMLKTDYDNQKGILIQVDSKNGKITYFSDLEFKYKNLNSTIISTEKAAQIATETCKKLGLEEENYKIFSIKEEPIFENSKSFSEWHIQFYKNNNNIINRYESISISFLITNDTIIYDTININIDTESIINPIVITEAEAVEIAKNKEKDLTNNEITGVIVERSVEKLNTFIYQLEYEIYNTNPYDGGTYLQTEDITRNVWKVLIQHNNKKDKNNYEDFNKYIKENADKYYFIDTTTGEIIGGTFDKNLF